MCTVGFWKDADGTRFYFKNRDNDFLHKNERCEVTQDGIFICDDGGKFEGMNRYGLFTVELTLVPQNPGRTKPKDSNHANRRVLLTCKTADEAKQYILDMWEQQLIYASTYFIGDAEKSYFIEVVPDNIAVADVTHAPYSVHTNHGILLPGEGIQDGPVREWSVGRLKIAQNFLKTAQSVDDIKAMLKSHSGGKNSICGHGLIFTQSSYIFCPDKMYGETIIGTPPCRGEYQRVYLKDK